MNNPCRDCERLHSDKNDPVCIQCNKRVAYVAAIDSFGRWAPNSQPVIVGNNFSPEKGEAMTKRQAPYERTKTCPDPECLRSGEPQPIGNFGRAAKTKDGLKNICRGCQARRIREGRMKMKAKNVGTLRPKATEPQPAPNNGGADVLNQVMRDLLDRSEFGTAKYGTRLQSGNGRDALMDAYQEALDLVMYLRQAIIERAG